MYSIKCTYIGVFQSYMKKMSNSTHIAWITNYVVKSQISQTLWDTLYTFWADAFAAGWVQIPDRTKYIIVVIGLVVIMNVNTNDMKCSILINSRARQCGLCAPRETVRHRYFDSVSIVVNDNYNIILFGRFAALKNLRRFANKTTGNAWLKVIETARKLEHRGAVLVLIVFAFTSRGITV